MIWFEISNMIWFEQFETFRGVEKIQAKVYLFSKLLKKWKCEQLLPKIFSARVGKECDFVTCYFPDGILPRRHIPGHPVVMGTCDDVSRMVVRC